MTADKSTLPKPKVKKTTKRKKAATLAREVRDLGRRIKGCPLPLVHRQHGSAEQAVVMFRDVERGAFLAGLTAERYARAQQEIAAFRLAVETWEKNKPAPPVAQLGAYCDRPGYAAAGELCDLSDVCQLIEGHGGPCDARTERERWDDLHRCLRGARSSKPCPRPPS